MMPFLDSAALRELGRHRRPKPRPYAKSSYLNRGRLSGLMSLYSSGFFTRHTGKPLDQGCSRETAPQDEPTGRVIPPVLGCACSHGVFTEVELRAPVPHPFGLDGAPSTLLGTTDTRSGIHRSRSAANPPYRSPQRRRPPRSRIREFPAAARAMLT